MNHVPSIQFNLFSVRRQLEQRGCDKVAIHFDVPGCGTALCETEATRVKLNRSNNLYQLKLKIVEGAIAFPANADVWLKDDTMRLWHKRLGHSGRNASESALREGAKQFGIWRKYSQWIAL